MSIEFDLKHYGYDLPEELIAQHPLKKRDEARLLVVDRQAGSLTHDVFKNIGQYLPKRAAFVVNDSKVIPARLFGRKSTGARVEIFVLGQKGGCYEVLMRPMKRLKEGERIALDGTCFAEIVDKEKRLVRFNQKDILKYLESKGHIPLPPYIKRDDAREDRTFYQTVYADKSGSVAAPTAGLHFTKPLIARLKKAGHTFSPVTLHVSYGTFKPVEEKDIRKHNIHTEVYSLKKSTLSALAKKPVVAVGTTSCRVLESYARTHKVSGETNLFIYPGFKFKTVDHLLTNFHLPYSSLLMLVHAFGGGGLIKKAYKEAIKEEYRFYSYGDCMLIL